MLAAGIKSFTATPLGTVLVTVVVVVLGSGPGPAAAVAQPAAATLETVLARAADYVERYQYELGSVIAEEHYHQMADGRRSRRMVSDLLVLATPGTQEPWLAFRDVIEVDGKPVEDRLQRLEDLFLQTPRITGALRRRLIIESARFNIGAITRNVNVPTMALQILASSDQSRFTFEQDGEKTIDGIRTWEIDYEETEPPAMIKNGQGDDLFSHGTVWIEPSSGRVVETDFRTEDKEIQLSIELRVRYQQDETLGMLVPSRMTERYHVRLRPITNNPLARRSIEVNCEATYTNFRRFQVEVEIDLGAARQ